MFLTPSRLLCSDVVGEGADVVPVGPVRVEGGGGVAVGGVGDVAGAGPGAPADRVRGGGVMRDPAPHTGAGGAVALALVAGARLPRPAGQA